MMIVRNQTSVVDTTPHYLALNIRKEQRKFDKDSRKGGNELGKYLKCYSLEKDQRCAGNL